MSEGITSMQMTLYIISTNDASNNHSENLPVGWYRVIDEKTMVVRKENTERHVDILLPKGERCDVVCGSVETIHQTLKGCRIVRVVAYVERETADGSSP